MFVAITQLCANLLMMHKILTADPILSLSHALHAEKLYAILSTICLALQYQYLLNATVGCSLHEFIVQGLMLSGLGWLFVLVMDIEKQFKLHFAGAFLFSIGYIGAFPIAIMCNPSAALWLLYVMAVVCDTAFAVLFNMGHLPQAYICEWMSFLFFCLSLMKLN